MREDLTKSFFAHLIIDTRCASKMMFRLMLLSWVWVASTANAGSMDDCNVSPISNCSLYSFDSDMVTPEQMQNQNVMGVHWLMIYYSEFDDHQTYGKCNMRWHQPDSDNIVRKESMCYNYDTDKCENFEQRLRRKTDSCGRVEENAVNVTMDAKFYSQDLSQYIWYDTCYAYKDNGDCEVQYIDLLVRKSRYPDKDGENPELDLQGLPWHLISADLKNNFNMDISNIQMKFSWKDKECGFDGNLITSDALQRQANYVALMMIAALTFIF